MGGKRLTQTRRSLLALALVAATILGGLGVPSAVPTASAAVPWTPDLKLPFTCGTTWKASTYGYYLGHFHGNALDFNLANGAEDSGQAVAAAAAGRIVSTTPSSGRVLIDHGGGWRTLYLHMTDLQVTANQWVSEGQWIGRVGSLGLSTGPHLHFELHKDGIAVKPVVFDGTAVNISETTTQTLTSTNCLPGQHGLWFANSMVRAPDGTVDFVSSSGERYWVPNQTVLNCLASNGAKLRNVSWQEFSANPRNRSGDPAGRWADCASWTLGWMIKGSGPAVWYVAPNGLRYHVPDEATVMCLGGWAAVRPVTDGTLSQVPPNQWAQKAHCQTPLYGELIRSVNSPAVYYVSPRGWRYWVSNSDIVGCLTGWPQVVLVRSARASALPANPYGLQANCNAPVLDRLIRKADGTVDYVRGNYQRYWVPNGNVVGCLGGWNSVIFLANARFDALRRNTSNAWADCATRN